MSKLGGPGPGGSSDTGGFPGAPPERPQTTGPTVDEVD